MFTILLAAVLAQAPAPARPEASPALKAQRSLDLTREAQRRKLNRVVKKQQARTKAQQDAYQRAQQAAYEERMAPIWEEQRRHALAEIQAQQRANALSAIAGAAQQEALTDRQRLAIQARRAGYPQVGPYQSVPLPP